MVESSYKGLIEPRFGRPNLKSRQMRWYTYTHTYTHTHTSKMAQKRMVSGTGNPAWWRTRPELVCCEAWWLRSNYMAFCLGDWEQVQNKWFDSHLTSLKKWKFKLAHGNNSTLQRLSVESKIVMQMRHFQKVCSVITKDTVGFARQCDAGVVRKLDIVCD